MRLHGGRSGFLYAMLIARNMIREYLRYVIPTAITFTLISVYSIVDGAFVGHAVGDAGIAGLNVAWPALAFILAVGTGLGMGGGVISSIERGAGNMKTSQEAVGTTFVLLICVSIPIMVLFFLFAEPLCALLGGQGETLAQSSLYLSIIAWGAPFQVFSAGCAPLIRNQGHVAYAVFVQITACIVNIILDYFFVLVFGWGTAGAGFATDFSQLLACVFIVAFFVRRSNRVPRAAFHPRASLAAHTMKLGIAPFGLTLVPEAAVIVFNINMSLYGGELALASYAVVSYTVGVIQTIIQSVGDGSQPLISRYFGAKDYGAVRCLRNTNYVVALGIGLLGLLAVTLLRQVIPLAFGSSPQATEIIAAVMPIFAVAYVLFGFMHASTSYFYAIDDAKSSSAIIYGEAVLVIIVVCALGYLFGVDGLWLAMITVQIILSCFTGWLLYRRHKQGVH